MYRRRDAAAAADEVSRRENIHGHDRRAAEEAAKLDHLAHFAAGRRHDAHGCGFVVHHADGHFIGDERGDCFRRKSIQALPPCRCRPSRRWSRPRAFRLTGRRRVRPRSCPHLHNTHLQTNLNTQIIKGSGKRFSDSPRFPKTARFQPNARFSLRHAR